MRPQKVEEEALLAGLMSVIRIKGYEGASLNELAAASGLQKASLYHRFPGGKQEIVAAVLDYVGKWVNENIYALLTNEKMPPAERLGKVIENIDLLYDHGKDVCILRALSMDTGVRLFGKQIQQSMSQWIAGFKHLGISLGFEATLAESTAYQTLIQVQGSLVVSKGMSTVDPFQNALVSIKNMYLGT
jgi:AcrR family transcriptional regulator